MRVIPHCRVHGLGQSLCCRASPPWAQVGKRGLECQEQPLWRYCGREKLEIFWTSLQLFLRKWDTMGKVQMSQTPADFGGEKSPWIRPWMRPVHFRNSVCDNVGKLWYSLRQQTFLLSSFAFKMSIWYIIQRRHYWGQLCHFLCQVFRESGPILGCYWFQIWQSICNLLSTIIVPLPLF